MRTVLLILMVPLIGYILAWALCLILVASAYIKHCINGRIQ